MGYTLKEALLNAGVPLSSEEELAEQDMREAKHRTKAVMERPKEEFELKKITLEPFERKKYQSDPTDSLKEVRSGLKQDKFKDELDSYCPPGAIPYAVVWCKDTEQTWLVIDKLCLDQNFIFREDLEILRPKSTDEVCKFYEERGARSNGGIVTRKTCYILDNPANEHYEVYYDTAYPSLKYGKATPNGMFVHKCKDRFHRDMKIMELDGLYQEESATMASKLTKKPLGANEAIIISDGCFKQNVCASAFYYLDSTTLIKLAQGIIPSEPDQAVLISEVSGAIAALEMCMQKGRKSITYYYDNTSILNVFRNRKTEYIREIVEYKELVTKMDQLGYTIKFVELHPKTGEDRDRTNKALMFFHNYCDKECTDMARVFAKDYRSIAMSDSSDGKTYKQVKNEFKPKGKPGQGSGSNGVQNNQKNGNNKYGKKF